MRGDPCGRGEDIGEAWQGMVGRIHSCMLTQQVMTE